MFASSMRTCEPLPIGAAGELFIGGAGLAAGYVNQPNLTAQRFIDNPLRDKRARGCIEPAIALVGATTARWSTWEGWIRRSKSAGIA